MHTLWFLRLYTRAKVPFKNFDGNKSESKADYIWIVLLEIRIREYYFGPGKEHSCPRWLIMMDVLNTPRLCGNVRSEFSSNLGRTERLPSY